MEVLGWLLLAPVLAVAVVVLAAVVLAGAYGLALAGLATALVLVHGAAGTGGLVVAALGVLLPVVVALVLRRRRAREPVARPTETSGAAPAPAPPPQAVRPDGAVVVPAPGDPATAAQKGRCPVCRRSVAITPARGRIKTHVTRGERCRGMGMAPAIT